MKSNVGGVDRKLRILIGIVLLSTYAWPIAGLSDTIWPMLGLGAEGIGHWALIGLVPLGTGLMGWCPPYAIFGISSCSTKNGS